MVDKIQTELDIDLKQGKTLSDVKEIAGALKEAQESITGNKLAAADLNNNFRAVLGTLKEASVAMAELKSLAQGSVTSVLNRTALTGARNEAKGTDQSITLALMKDQATVATQLAKAGRDQYQQDQLKLQLRKQIWNGDTIAYKVQQQEILIGRLAVSNLENKNKLLKEAYGVYDNLKQAQASLATLEQNRLAYGKQQDALRKKELADAERAIVLAGKKAAKEKEQDAKTGGGIINEINRKSMGQLLITQTKLLLNYQLLGTALSSFQFSITYVRELDKAFRELQAIGSLTETQMVGLKDAIIDVAGSSKFSAVEVGQAAITLAQAGYSGTQIEGSIRSITLLAQAAGTDLKTAVDITTSVLNVFNYQVEQTEQVANTLTYALNVSKLSIDQLGLGIQYAANVAADANISFGEMIASFGVLSDAGIRSGSTIGTGYRQLLNDIQAPSDKLKNRLSELGLSLEDVDLKTKGLVGVLKTLRAAGFTSADALETLEVRAAATFSALQQGLDTIGAQERAMLLSTAATKASEIQMKSLDSVVKQLQGNLGSLAYSMTQGLLSAFISVFKAVNSVIIALKPFSEILGTIALVAVGGILIKLISLEKIIFTVIGAFNLFTGVIGALGTAGMALRTVFLGVQAVMISAFATSLWTGWGLVIGGVSLAIYALYEAFQYFSKGTKTVSDAIEENATKINETTAELEKYQAQGRQVTNFVQTLRDQHKLLTTDTDAMKTKTLEAKLAFEGLGGTIINLSDDYNTLLGKMVEVQIATEKQISIAAGAASAAQRVSILNTNNAINANRDELRRASLTSGLSSFSKEDQILLKSLVNQGTSDATTRNENGSSQFITDFNKFLDLNEKSKDADQLKYLNRIKPFLEQINKGIKDNIGATEKQREFDREIVRSNFDKDTARLTAIVATGARTAIGEASDKLSRARSSEDFGEVARIYQNIQSTLTKGEKLTTSALEFIGRTTPLDSTNKSQIDELITFAKKQGDAASLLKSKFSVQETEVKLTSLNTEIQRLKTESKVSNLADKAQTIKAIEDAYAKKTEFELARNFAEINAPDYLIKQGRDNLTDKAGQISQRSDDLIEKNKETIAENNRLRDKDLQEFGERMGKINAAVEDGLLPSITKLQLAFKSLSNDLEIALKKADSDVNIKKAQNSALDVGNNKFNVTDAQRYKSEQELEKLEAIRAQKRLAAYEATVEPLKQQVADLDRVKLALEEQGRAAGITAADLGGSAFGQQAGQRLKNLQTQYKSTLTEIEKANKASEELPINLALARAEFEALNTPIQAKPVWDVFSESLEVYMDQQTKLSKSNAELGRGFTEIFDNVNNGFANVVKNIATGTGSIKSSFRDMATSIISDLLDIASKRAAAGIFDSIFGSVVGAITGGITQSAAPISGLGDIQVTDLPAIGAAQGGIVKGNLPRDSVRMNLMPGEGVLTRTAVSMIGEDAVNALNGAGNRVATQSSPKAMEASNSNSPPLEQNIYLVDSRQQMPSMGPNDVVMIVADNINRSGSLRKAVRSAMG